MMLFSALAITSCQQAPIHTEATTIATVVIIIVDSKGAPLNQSGVTVTDNYGTGNILHGSTSTLGQTTFHIADPTFPMTFTATDAAHHIFSHPVKETLSPNPDTIKIVENVLEKAAALDSTATTVK